jgi:uncharacterized protein
MGRWRNPATGCSVDTQRSMKLRKLASLANLVQQLENIVSPWLGEDSETLEIKRKFKSRPVHIFKMHKIIYTADLHGNKPFYERLAKRAKEIDVKAVVLGGDLCPRTDGDAEENISFQSKFIKEFMIPLLHKLKKDVYLIMGNDDFRINFPLLEKAGKNIHSIHKRSMKIHDKSVAGYSFVNPTPFRLKDWEKPDDEKKEKPKQIFDIVITSAAKEDGTIEQDLQNMKGNSIYVTHAPPFGTKLDAIADEMHVGSKAIKRFIDKEQPLLTLHGHIHESPKISGSWIDKIGKTISINVGSSYPEDKLNCAIIDLDDLDNIKYQELLP